MHLGCVFEDILKIIRMGKAKTKGGGKKRKNAAKKNTWRQATITWEANDHANVQPEISGNI